VPSPRAHAPCVLGSKMTDFPMGESVRGNEVRSMEEACRDPRLWRSL